MSRPARIPPELADRIFTSRQAADLGVTQSMLRGPHFTSVRRGVWRLTTTDMTFDLDVRAARHELPTDACLSHVSALQWYGVSAGRSSPLHFSTRSMTQTRHDDVELHRRVGRLTPRDVRDVPVLGPDRSFVDSATILGLRHLVRAGDALIRQGWTSLETLIEYVVTSHLDGVIRAREAALLVRERVDSVRETDVRLLLVLSGLPEPETNTDVYSDDGEWVARGDLVLRQHRIIVEHDGWHHERDAEQRQKDHLRRERIEAAGWTLIVITVDDFAHPTAIVARVFEALVRAGYRGPPPELGRRWHQIAHKM